MKVAKVFPCSVREIETVWITMPDGCRLAARLWLPEGAEGEPVPAILEYIPYRRRDFMAIRDSVIHPYLAGHGYACIRVDLRGSGDSDGILEDEYLQQELDDAVEVIRWIVEQVWCTGSVGMMGISWGGFNSLQVAAMRPSGLKAIITACSTDDRYADDSHFMGGCFLSENVRLAARNLSFSTRPPDLEIVGERWRDMWLERLERNNPTLIDWLAHQRRDDFWKHGSVCENFAEIECAVYAVGGWADAYSNAIPRMLGGLTCPRKGLIGPWSHGWPHMAVPGPAIGFLQDALRWWDYWLKGQDNGIMDEPMLRIWMQESVPPKPRYEERPGRWIAEPAWPSSNVKTQRFALNPGQIDREPGPEEVLIHDSPQTVGVMAGEFNPHGHSDEMAGDQRWEDGASLVFDSDSLAECFEILGAPVVELALAADRPRAFVAVRLNDVAPGGAATRVSYGLLNLTHRNGHERPEAVEPGKVYRVRVRLNDVAHSFPVGHRIRVSLSSAYWPLVWPSPKAVRFEVIAGASALELPERPPRSGDGDLVPFGPAEGAEPLAHRILWPDKRGRFLQRDVATATTVMTEAVKERTQVELPDIALTYSCDGHKRFEIKDGEPLSATAEAYYSTRYQRGDWCVRTETRMVLSATEDDFLLTATLDAFESDTRILTRSWSERIARDLL